MDETKWALFQDWSQWKMLPIDRQTNKTVMVLDGSRVRHIMSGNVQAIGAEAVLRPMMERLTSSESLHKDEVRKSGQRRNERNAAIIASLP